MTPTSNLIYHKQTKHINSKYHFIQNFLANGKVVVTRIAMVENPTNLMMKHAPLAKLKLCLNSIMVCIEQVLVGALGANISNMTWL